MSKKSKEQEPIEQSSLHVGKIHQEMTGSGKQIGVENIYNFNFTSSADLSKISLNGDRVSLDSQGRVFILPVIANQFDSKSSISNEGEKPEEDKTNRPISSDVQSVIERGIAKKLKDSACRHSEQLIGGEKKHLLFEQSLEQLGSSLEKEKVDKVAEKAYKRLIVLLETNQLFRSDLYRFANLCYQYWHFKLPSLEKRRENQKTINAYNESLKPIAKGRTLFRCSGERERYYWGSKSSSSESSVLFEKGIFYSCYPDFVEKGEVTKTIYDDSEVLDSKMIDLCKEYTKAQHLQREGDTLWGHINLLYEKLRHCSIDNTSLICDLQLAWLCFRSGYLICDSSLSLKKVGYAVFYLKNALGTISTMAFLENTNLQPSLPKELVTVADELQALIDQCLVQQAQQMLFEEESKELQIQWDQCYKQVELKTVHGLSQKTATLLSKAENVSVVAKRSLMEKWMQGFNTTSEFDYKAVTVAMKEAVKDACSIANSDPYALSTIDKWVQKIAEYLKENQQRQRAHVLVDEYYKLLDREFHRIEKQEKTEGPHSDFFKLLLPDLKKALSEQKQVLGKIDEESPSVPKVEVEIFANRHLRDSVKKWSLTLAPSFKSEAIIAHDIHSKCFDFIKNYLTQICIDIERQLLSSPSAFTLLGVDCLSRGESTPVSSLDVVLLVADKNKKSYLWFRCFLQLLQWKLSALPKNTLSVKQKTISFIEDDTWWDTSKGLIKKHLTEPYNLHGQEQPENFVVQWATWIYAAGGKTQADDDLFNEHRRELRKFFKTPTKISPYRSIVDESRQELREFFETPILPPYYQDRSIRSLMQYLKVPGETSRKELVSRVMQNSLIEMKSDKEIKDHVEIQDLELFLSNINHAILCYGRFINIDIEITQSQEILVQLKSSCFLPKAFLKRVEEAYQNLYIWRLRQHWDWLPHSSLLKLSKGEVLLWKNLPSPETSFFTQLSRGFYLNEEETRRFLQIQVTVTEVMTRSVGEFFHLPRKISSSNKDMVVEQKEKEPGLDQRLPVTSGEKIEDSVVILKEGPERKEEVKSPPEDKIAHSLFDPLSCAVTACLQALPKLCLAAAKKEIYWLADCLSECAKELPVPDEKKDNDPCRVPHHVQQDGLLHRHWRVYQYIPVTHRLAYLQRLRTRLDPSIYEVLVLAPDPSGRRAWTEHETSKWQRSMRQLCEKKPLPKFALSFEEKAEIKSGKTVWLQWVANGKILWAPLKRDYMKFLFDRKGQWLPKEQKSRVPLVDEKNPSSSSEATQPGGNHRVYCLQVQDKPHFWVKLYPEQPGTEYLVHALDQRLGVNGTPNQQLIAVHHRQLRMQAGIPVTRSAVLLTQHVGTHEQTLSYVANHRPEELQSIDFLSFARTLLRVLLTNPEDDKGSDYFLVPIPGTDRYQLIRIDNERAFFPATKILSSRLTSKEELQIKSMLYCLDQMTTPWSSEPRIQALLDDFLQLQPVEVIRDLFAELAELHPQWERLFPEEVVTSHALCGDPWVSLPVLVIPDGLETTLFKRLNSLQAALRLLKPPQITGLKLLEMTQPKLAKYYKPLFNPKLTKKLPIPTSRFHYIAGQFYQQQGSEYYTSLSGVWVLSRGLSLLPLEFPKNKNPEQVLIDLAKDIRMQRRYSVLQANEKIKRWQNVPVDKIVAHLLPTKEPSGIIGLTASDLARIQFESLSSREQQLVFDQVIPKPNSGKTLTLAQQRYLLELLAETQCRELNLTGFAQILIRKLLLPILRQAGEQITTLNLSTCTRLKPAILADIKEYCPNLRRLYLNDQSEWTNLSLGYFEELTELSCERATQLTSLNLLRLPKLKKLSLAGAEVLRILGGRSSINTTAYLLPHLCHINITGCMLLQKIHIEVRTPNQLKWQVDGCTLAVQQMLQSPIANFNYSEAIRLKPDDAEFYNGRGRNKYDQKDYAGAVADCTAAIRLKSDDPGFYYWCGAAKFAQNNYVGAIKDYTTAIQLKKPGEDAGTYYWRATARAAQNNYAGAIEDYTAAIRLKPDDPGSYYQRGIVRYDQNDYAGAVEDYTKAIRLKPDDPGFYYQRGAVRYDQSDYAGAIEDYTKAIELKPNDSGSYCRRGNAKSAQNDYPGAIADYSEAIRLKPNGAALYCRRALIHEIQGNMQQAKEDRQHARPLETSQYTPAEKQRLAFIYIKLGNHFLESKECRPARVYYTEAIHLQPENAQAYLSRAEVYTALGNHSQAEMDYERGAKLLGAPGETKAQPLSSIVGGSSASESEVATAAASVFAATSRRALDDDIAVARGTTVSSSELPF